MRKIATRPRCRDIPLAGRWQLWPGDDAGESAGDEFTRRLHFDDQVAGAVAVDCANLWRRNSAKQQRLSYRRLFMTNSRLAGPAVNDISSHP